MKALAIYLALAPAIGCLALPTGIRRAVCVFAYAWPLALAVRLAGAFGAFDLLAFQRGLGVRAAGFDIRNVSEKDEP